MRKAFQLGFVEFAAPRLEQELQYDAEMIGSTVTESEGDGSAYLSLDLNHHNIALRGSDQTEPRCLGPLVTNDIAIKDWAARIEAYDLKPSVKTDARPGVPKLVEVPLHKLHHIGFELKEQSHHRDAGALLSSHKVLIIWDPARRTAGHNLASNYFDPDQVPVELYANMDICVAEQRWLNHGCGSRWVSFNRTRHRPAAPEF